VTTPETIRVAMIDDHTLFRRAMCEALARESDIEVVAQADRADGIVELIHSSRPDVVLMDIDMPGLTAFEAVRRVNSIFPHVRVIIVSAFHSDQYIEQALAANAHGYLTKNEEPEELLRAVRKVVGDELYFSPVIWGRLVISPKGIRLVEGAPTVRSKLTIREVEVLRYVAEGLSKKEMARTMSLSVKTVDRHVTRLMEKLDIHDRVELARYAIREGFVQL
jgi:DNA-binding NarL/FixJ family response regulator